MGPKYAYGMVWNDSDIDIYYSVSTEKLILENMETADELTGGMELKTTMEKAAEAGLHLDINKLVKKKIKGGINVSRVKVPPKCALNVGLTKVEKLKDTFSLWYGSDSVSLG